MRVYDIEGGLRTHPTFMHGRRGFTGWYFCGRLLDMIIVEAISPIRQRVARARQEGKVIGLVPTLGGLHEGHFSLIRRSCSECDFTVVSIFVNPTQFGAGEDLAKYPRTMEADCQACRELGVDLVFAPMAEEMYPQEDLTWVSVEKLTEHLCGASRRGHFRGVCTVVAKLLNIVGPDVAYFGEKDAQQLAVIRRMVDDLNMNVEIRACPTVREDDGVAMSTRNGYLNAEQRRQATCLHEALARAAELVGGGETSASAIVAGMEEIIKARPEASIDYISIVDNVLLQPVDIVDRPVLVAMAVKIGAARLIDNIVVDPKLQES